MRNTFLTKILGKTTLCSLLGNGKGRHSFTECTMSSKLHDGFPNVLETPDKSSDGFRPAAAEKSTRSIDFPALFAFLDLFRASAEPRVLNFAVFHAKGRDGHLGTAL